MGEREGEFTVCESIPMTLTAAAGMLCCVGVVEADVRCVC